MKLIIAVVNKKDHPRFSDALVDEGFRFTELGSTGGFLREGNTTLLLGVDDDKVDRVLALLEELCHTRERVISALPATLSTMESVLASPMKVEIGGAKAFVVDVDRFMAT